MFDGEGLPEWQITHIAESKCLGGFVGKSDRFPHCLKLGIWDRLAEGFIACLDGLVATMLFYLAHKINGVIKIDGRLQNTIRNTLKGRGEMGREVLGLGGGWRAGGYNIMMERNLNNKKASKAVTLFDYALTTISKPKEKPINPPTHKSISIIQPMPTQQSASRSQWTYGLDTLLHFNDSLNLSSINPSRLKTFSPLNQTNRYQQMINQAKQDVERMKNKRLESEKQWKRMKISNKEELDASLEESVVTEYDLDSEVYPLSTQKIHNNTDRFAAELREQIIKGKIAKFSEKLKAIFTSKFIKEIRMFDQILTFQSKRNKSTLRLYFKLWKEVIDQLQSRKNIRAAVLRRIHQKKLKINEEEYLNTMLNA